MVVFSFLTYTCLVKFFRNRFLRNIFIQSVCPADTAIVDLGLETRTNPVLPKSSYRYSGSPQSLRSFGMAKGIWCAFIGLYLYMIAMPKIEMLGGFPQTAHWNIAGALVTRCPLSFESPEEVQTPY